MSPRQKEAKKKESQFAEEVLGARVVRKRAEPERVKSTLEGDPNNNIESNFRDLTSIDQKHSSIINKLVTESADYLARKPAEESFTPGNSLPIDGLFEMDTNAKDRKNVSAATADNTQLAPTATGSEPAKTSGDPVIPSYSSIFNTNYYRRSSNSPQLKKQSANLDYSEQSTLRLSSIEHTRKQIHSQDLASDEDNNENERLPLSGGSKIDRQTITSKRVSPNESANVGSQQHLHHNGNNKRLQITNFDHYPVTTGTREHHALHNQHLAGNKHSPHTKISFSSTRHNNAHQPNSFAGDHHHVGESHFGSHSKRLDWQESGSCLDCDCNSCYVKFKNALSHDGSCCRRFGDMHNSQKNISSRTRNLHLVLKSIILILLTLLLLMIFFGIIAATHYLPEVFDKLLSATRSFNVTIAG